ncbi:MAG: TrmH family RNA methyltransferase [Bacteroidetes bacterium]|nr:MAG: TrmH family RNA methyltransferase [Bacteroidota bacterium]
MRKLKLEELGRVDPVTYQQQEKHPVALVLDNVRSALNVGSAFRTADAFALEHVFLCGITAQPPHREILKTALGATETVAWSYAATAADCVAQLQGQGYQLWPVEQVDERTWLQDFKAREHLPLALVFGNEVQGVSEEFIAAAAGVLEIPQYGTKHSLNVAVSLGISIWEVIRQIKFTG